MPNEQQLRVLASLRSATDAPTILNVLRGGVESPPRPSNLALVKAITAKPAISLELFAQHPFAYPKLQSVEFDELEGQGLYSALPEGLAEASIAGRELSL